MDVWPTADADKLTHVWMFNRPMDFADREVVILNDCLNTAYAYAYACRFLDEVMKLEERVGRTK